jgi:hypothetical protein
MSAVAFKRTMNEYQPQNGLTGMFKAKLRIEDDSKRIKVLIL